LILFYWVCSSYFRIVTFCRCGLCSQHFNISEDPATPGSTYFDFVPSNLAAWVSFLTGARGFPPSACRPTLGSTQPHIYSHSPGLKMPGREAEHTSVLWRGSLSGPQLVFPLYAFSVSTETASPWPVPVWFPMSFVSLCKFLDAFAESRRANSFFVMCVSIRLFVCPSLRPPARMEQLGSHWMYFHEVYCSNIFRKSLEKTQV